MTNGFVTGLNPCRLSSLIEEAIAVKPRGGAANDRLQLTRISGRLQVEWRARGVHPWDRDIEPCLQIEIYRDQAMHDTDAAINGLFALLPKIELLEISVFDSEEPTKLILAGAVTREEALANRSCASIAMRLKMLGVRYSRVIGASLETLVVDPAPTPAGV